VKGYGGVSAAGDFDAQITEARKAVLRQLLAWERDFSAADGDESRPQVAGEEVFDDRIYVFTPQAAIVELVAGATPIDFAYTVHTDLGHRCRGAKVDGVMVPLNTPLQSGQTVEVTAVKEGGPSLDWLNAELGYLKSHRSKAKVRGWFNLLAQAQTIARGREAVEKLLQREGKTALKLTTLAEQLGFRHADDLFEVVGKDEFSLRTIENLLRPTEPVPTADEVIALRKPRSDAELPQGGVLVVGVESLLTSLARCCRPAPPDAIGGYVTRGKGVAIHRVDCSNFRELAKRSPERLIAVTWGRPRAQGGEQYPVDVLVEAADRRGLLRDISEVFAKDQMNVTGVKTQSVKDASGGTAWMTFTVEIADSARLGHVLGLVQRVEGVRSARRK
jgi:GTP pyrophosphokinase